MKNKLLLFVLLLLFSTEVLAAPPSPWLPCSDGDGYCIDVDLDGVSDFRINSSGSMSYVGTKGDASFGTVTADEVNAGSVTMGIPYYDHTTDATLTAAQMKHARNTNQGASAEVDLTMPTIDLSYQALFRQEEAQVMEIGPPSGGIIVLDGTALDADDCVDSDGSTIGSWMLCEGGKIADGTSVYFCDSDGNWVDTGASD